MIGPHGHFITLEGGEGVGKSTQAEALTQMLRARGHDVIVTREPGGSPGAEAIRALLMQGEGDRWSARAEALLFAAARADHVEKTIRPALDTGRWVICDRFVDSTRAYQGGGGGLSDDEIMALHRIGSENLLPERTLLLHLEPEDASSRAIHRDGGAADRFALQTLEYHLKVSARFLDMAALDPLRFRLVPASGSPSEVTGRLFAAIEDLL